MLQAICDRCGTMQVVPVGGRVPFGWAEHGVHIFSRSDGAFEDDQSLGFTLITCGTCSPHHDPDIRGLQQSKDLFLALRTNFRNTGLTVQVEGDTRYVHDSQRDRTWEYRDGQFVEKT